MRIMYHRGHTGHEATRTGELSACYSRLRLQYCRAGHSYLFQTFRAISIEL